MIQITHRCEGSLKNEVSIRYTKEFQDINYSSDYIAWRLFKATEFEDGYGEMYLKHISEIKFCPFCGKELKDVQE